MKQKQPWLHSALTDSVFILAPPFLCLLAVLLFPGFFLQANREFSLEAWVVLILLIDVGHVYSTLFRTYFDKQTFLQHRQLFIYAPIVALLFGIVLYALGSMIFWRVLAYLAVFHFVRQQYGFMRLYSRKEIKKDWESLLDKITIYAATVYPLLYWHLESKRNFNWFLRGDFLTFSWPEALPFLTAVYVLLLSSYLVKEILFSIWNRQVNIPRNIVITGTALSWYLGIVYFNGDLIFTLFNVISHGIPYLALVWFYGNKQYKTNPDIQTSRLLKYTFSAAGVFIFLTIVFGFAYLEEGLWDTFVWHEHATVFPAFNFFENNSDEILLNVLVPVLALPQLTHYILDGFIWKVSQDKRLG